MTGGYPADDRRISAIRTAGSGGWSLNRNEIVCIAHLLLYKIMIFFYKHLTFTNHTKENCLEYPLPEGGYPPVIRRISVTSRMGFENFAKHIIKENNCIYWNHHGAVLYQTIKNAYNELLSFILQKNTEKIIIMFYNYFYCLIWNHRDDFNKCYYFL